MDSSHHELSKESNLVHLYGIGQANIPFLKYYREFSRIHGEKYVNKRKS